MSDCKSRVLCKEEILKMYKLFEGYSPEYLKQPSEIVAAGGSGVTLKVPFVKGSVTQHALLKVERGEDPVKADNLFREGMIGEEINKMAIFFPLFVNTLGLLRESQNGEYAIEIESEDKKERETIKFHRLTHEATIADACTNFGKEGLLLEYIHGVPFKDKYKMPEFEPEILPAVFQIYYTLWMLGDDFTHYDLHTGNVLLTELRTPDNKKACMLFEYTLPNGEVVRFMGSNVAYLIDYGRCFVKHMQKKLNHEIKHIPECNGSRCGHYGDKCGFRNFDHPKHEGLGFKQANVSHDLRLLNYVVRVLKERGKWKGPDVLFNGQEEGKGFSTVEIAASGLNENEPNGGLIHNVMDAGTVLANMVKNNFDYYKGMKVLGVLQVDGKKPWKFREKDSPSSRSDRSHKSRKSSDKSDKSHKSHKSNKSHKSHKSHKSQGYSHKAASGGNRRFARRRTAKF